MGDRWHEQRAHADDEHEQPAPDVPHAQADQLHRGAEDQKADRVDALTDARDPCCYCLADRVLWIR